jgi:hypothetical protein
MPHETVSDHVIKYHDAIDLMEASKQRKQNQNSYHNINKKISLPKLAIQSTHNYFVPKRKMLNNKEKLGLIPSSISSAPTI